MSDRDLTAVEILTRHLAALTADLERVLSKGSSGQYGPAPIRQAICDTVAHLATLTQGVVEGRSREQWNRDLAGGPR